MLTEQRFAVQEASDVSPKAKLANNVGAKAPLDYWFGKAKT